MSSDLSNKNKRNRYKQIDEDKRMEIIQKIIKKGESLKSVSEETGVNISTCKAILKVYQQEGRVGKKKTRNKIVDVIETYSFYCLQNSQLTKLCPMKIETGKVSVGQQEDLDDLIKESCKQKGQKMLKQAMQTRQQINNAVNQSNPPREANQNQSTFQNIQAPYGYFPYTFYIP